jgi:hypothetical protein
MRFLNPLLPLALLMLLPHAHAATEPDTSRIVLMRHAEKPAKGLGQLSCRGLQRALQLPDVLIKRFGQPDIIMAPNPSHVKPDHGIIYPYIRPLATIEPTAIRLEMPVDVSLGFEKADALRKRLVREVKQPAQIWVAWEHKVLVKMERALLKDLHAPATAVDDWDDKDFDRIDVIEIRQPHGRPLQVTYERQREDLNDLPDTCPH